MASELVTFKLPMDGVYAKALLRFVRRIAAEGGVEVEEYNQVRYFCESDVRCSTTLVGDGDVHTAVIHTDLAKDLQDSDFYTVLRYLDCIGVAVESFSFRYNGGNVVSDIVINSEAANKGYYVRNLETGKLELYFEKEYYLSLPESAKKNIKSNYLFGKGNGGRWVSRAKFPNLWRAESVAIELGLENRGTIGEKISFEEQMERKAERAEARAERYMQYSENAEKRGNQLQSGFKEAARDISFVTQPNINSSAGRSFTRYRERLLAAYDRGFEEFKKSEYYADKAEAAMATAHSTKPTDKGFILRREAECEKSIRAQKKNIEKYDSYMKRLESGEVLHTIKGDELSKEKVQEWLDHAYEIIDDNLSKLVYYDKCMEELGGVNFSKENIKKGYKVRLKRWGLCEVAGTGPKNITYVILDGGAKGMSGVTSYADIEEVVSTDTSKVDEEMHPFKVGDVYTVSEWDSNKREYVEKKYEVIKVSKQRVTVRSEDGRTVVRKPSKRTSWGGEVLWYLTINDGYRGYVCKKPE